jgi:hypothetical protein
MFSRNPEKVSAIADLRAFFGSLTGGQLWAALASVAITIVVVTGFLIENRWGYVRPTPMLVYAQSWKSDRGRADAITAQREALLKQRLAILEFQSQLAPDATAGARKWYRDLLAQNAKALADLEKRS